MKSNTQGKIDASKTGYFHRMRWVFWGWAICLSIFTFFGPMLTESTGRLSMACDYAISGYEMVAYTPILATFVITAPILTAMLHTAEISFKMKYRMYHVLGLLLGLAFAGCLFFTLMELLNEENRIAMYSGGAYIVFVANFLNLSLGMIPTIWMIEDEENYDDEYI